MSLRLQRIIHVLTLGRLISSLCSIVTLGLTQ